VHIKADLTRLFKDCGFIFEVDQPFVGAIELGSLARDQNLVERSNVSLVDLASTVLHRYLPKDPSIRVSTEWDNPELTPQQVSYASLDVYTSWLIYEKLCLVPTGGQCQKQLWEEHLSNCFHVTNVQQLPTVSLLQTVQQGLGMLMSQKLVFLSTSPLSKSLLTLFVLTC
jgi:hypothetical protein